MKSNILILFRFKFLFIIVNILYNNYFAIPAISYALATVLIPTPTAAVNKKPLGLNAVFNSLEIIFLIKFDNNKEINDNIQIKVW